MKNQDILQRFIFENMPIRGEIVRLKQSFQVIIKQHEYSPLIQALLGEALALICLLAATIKFKGRMTLQFQGKGKLKLLLAQCSQDFHCRGLVQVNGEITEAELIEEFKKGVLAIMMDPDASGRRYQGLVSWSGTSLTESIEGYFRDSEQLPTRIWLAVNGEQVSGLLLQMMPETKPNEYHGKSDYDWEHVIHLAQTIKSEEMLTLDNETILRRLFSSEEVRLFQGEAITFRCTCSVERGENAILLLSREEAEEELRDKQVLVVTCEFCNKEYRFDRVDVERIFRKGGTPPSSAQIH